jgi:hypothetical protein
VQTWLRSLVNAILGRVPGTSGRPDTATRIAMDADFSDRREPTLTGCAASAGGTMDISSSRMGRCHWLAGNTDTTAVYSLAEAGWHGIMDSQSASWCPSLISASVSAAAQAHSPLCILKSP